MTTILSTIQPFLVFDEIDRARQEIEKMSISLEQIDKTVREFAALLALGSEQALEVALGVLGRKLINDDKEVNQEIIWLFLASVLSRKKITDDSPSRISILCLTSCVKSWEEPIFALLTPALDKFFQVSLNQNPLISEQNLDFLSLEAEIYGKAPHSKIQLKYFKNLTNVILEQVDDLDIKEEWAEGIEEFYQIANKVKYKDANIWSSGQNLLEEIYNSQRLEESDNFQVKTNILRLITSCLASLGTILEGDGLSLAIRIESVETNNVWSINANAIDQIQQLVQEVADVIFERSIKIPTFTPAQAITGSWTVIFQIDLTSERANNLAKAIASLPSIEYEDHEQNLLIANSWQDSVVKLKEENLKVNLAVSTNTPESIFSYAISTEDILTIRDSSQPHIRVISRDVPQADTLERVIDFVSLLIDYPLDLSIIKERFIQLEGITERQFHYYRRAAVILKLATERDQPTNAGYLLHRLPSIDKKMQFLAYQFLSSNVGSAWLKWQNANDPSDLQPERLSEFLGDVCPSLSNETINRRTQTLRNWLTTFRHYW